MKLNKKLLMAALAGAIVVTGGVGTFAEGETNPPTPVAPPTPAPTPAPTPTPTPTPTPELEENNENGYKTKDAAEKAAKKALENDSTNKSYTISQGAYGDTTMHYLQ